MSWLLAPRRSPTVPLSATFLLSALELMGPRYRTFAGMVISMFFASAMSLLAVLVTRIVPSFVCPATLPCTLACFHFAGLLAQALVHPVAGYLGSVRSSLQLLLDHSGVAAMASQQEQDRRGGGDRATNGEDQR